MSFKFSFLNRKSESESEEKYPVKKKFTLNYSFLALIIIPFILELFNFSRTTISNETPFNSGYRVLPVPIPDTMSFAGEPVPFNHLGVRENLEQEMLVNTYWQSQTLLALKRANRYFPIIEKILSQNGVPDDFKYLAMAESNFSFKTSPMGAAGFWQILKTTAASGGLEISKDVDERYNLEKSTTVACRYFKEAYEHFHNWTLVAASYNMGMGGVAKALQFQKQADYYDLGLNSETSRYVYRILALKELQSHPDRYGFFIKKSDLYPLIPSVEVKVDSTIDNLANYAICQQVNYRILKLMNPWLISSKLDNPEKKTYIFSFPKRDAAFIDLGETIVYNDTGKCVKNSVPDTITQFQYNGGKKIMVHFVKSGETLESIAQKYGVSVEQLCTWNSLSDSAKVKPKDEIMIFQNKP